MVERHEVVLVQRQHRLPRDKRLDSLEAARSPYLYHIRGGPCPAPAPTAARRRPDGRRWRAPSAGNSGIPQIVGRRFFTAFGAVRRKHRGAHARSLWNSRMRGLGDSSTFEAMIFQSQRRPPPRADERAGGASIDILIAPWLGREGREAPSPPSLQPGLAAAHRCARHGAGAPRRATNSTRRHRDRPAAERAAGRHALGASHSAQRRALASREQLPCPASDAPAVGRRVCNEGAAAELGGGGGTAENRFAPGRGFRPCRSPCTPVCERRERREDRE